MLSSFYLLLAPASISQDKQPQKAEDLVSFIKQKSGLELGLDDRGWQWKEEDFKGNQESGETTFSDSKWLMYLIHWGPIQVPQITAEYVKERMLKMWGVKFEFSGKEGKTKMAGHDAVWVEAYGTNRAFYTRFIVWNCQESGREFIADTNYNIRRKTPEEDFEKETRSARTVRCHEEALVENFADITKKFESEKYGLSFFYPEEWFMFESPYYVPFPQYQGIRGREMGSLLGLSSDENISVTLKWLPWDETAEKAPVMGVEQTVLENLIKEIKSAKDVESILNHGMENFTVNNRKIYRIWGNCRFKEPENESARSFYTGDGVYQVAQFNLEKKKKIMVILLTRQYRYGTAVSSPSRHFQDKLLRDFVLKMK
jgi:hypothetical protein